MKEKRVERYFPWIILCLALIIRLWGINFSLPFIYHVDEERFAQIALNYLRGDLNPHFFHVPSLYTYTVAGIWKLYYLIGHHLGLEGKFTSMEAFIAGFGRNPTTYMLLGRLLTVSMSVGTILALYYLGNFLIGPYGGLLAALALIFSPEHNKISHYLVPDAPMVLFLVLSYFFIFKIFKGGGGCDYFLSGLFAGLAFTTKYGGHFLIIPLFLAHFFSLHEKRKKWWSLSSHFGLIIWGITFILIFFLGTPYALLDYSTFWRDFRWQSSHLFSLGHFGSSTAQPAWLFYLQYGFAENVGFLFQFFVYAGIIWLLLKPEKKGLILLSFPLILFIIMGFWKTRATRYLLNLAPFFILIGVISFIRLIHYLTFFKWPGLLARFDQKKMASFIFILILTPSLWKVSRFNYSLLQEDTRTLAKHWIEANIPQGTRIALESYCPQISRKRYRVTYRHALYQADLEWLARRRIDYLITSDIMFARFTRFPQEFPEEAQFYQSLEEKAVLIKTFEPSWNEYLIDLHNPTLKIYRLSRRPDPSFPGFFQSYAHWLCLKPRTNSPTWEITISFEARAINQAEEIIKNLYLRAEDKEGNPIFFWPFYPQEIKSGETINFKTSQEIPPLKPGCQLYLGYEIKFLRLPLLQSPESFFRQEMKLVKAGVDWSPEQPVKLVFVYQKIEGKRGEEYFQKILLWAQENNWRLRSSLYGGELRWGNDEVLNPWIEISDLDNQQKQKIIIFSGRLGSTEGAIKAPVNIDQRLGILPPAFRLFVGYDFYKDLDCVDKAGGPEIKEIPLPLDCSDQIH
ncbi:MAG: glycosyltransferase family 39 protein [Candidatus Aminicenantes bacterium]|nr:glycosyltransferase family 39 protein [Candidatus Aminicenantes bacterium]